MVGECLYSFSFPINLHISSLNILVLINVVHINQSQCLTNSSRPCLRYCTLLYRFYVLMINYVCVHSLFFLSVAKTYIQSIIQTHKERKRERESMQQQKIRTSNQLRLQYVMKVLNDLPSYGFHLQAGATKIR